MGLDRRRRKLQEKLARIQSKGVTLDALLFGSDAPPDQEFAEQRRELVRRFRELMVEFRAGNAAGLRDYLYNAYKGYSVDRDGQSNAMALIWDIETLRELEAEHASGAGSDRV